MHLVTRKFLRLGHVYIAYCATALATATVAETKATKCAVAAAAVKAADLAIGLVKISRFSIEQLLLLLLRPLQVHPARCGGVNCLLST